jgi:O-antigen/teichoic acid export membrane protein
LKNLNTDYKEILSKGAAALAIRIMGFIAGYLFIYFTVKFFGAETQGRLTLSFSAMILGSLLCRLGVDVHFVKIFAVTNNFENARGLYFKISPLFLIISGTISVLLFSFAGLISEAVFHDPGLKPFLQITAPCVFLFTFILIHAAVFRGLKKNNLFAFLFNGGRFVFALLFFGILYLLFDFGDLAPIIAHTGAIFMLFAISGFYIYKFLFPRQRESKYRVKPFLSASLPMLLSASMIVLLGWSDSIVLGIFKDSTTVGTYSVVLKIAAVVSFSMQAIDSILAPKLSKSYHDNNLPLFKKLVIFTTKINSLISMLIVLGVLLFRDFILNIFGPEFELASTALVILCIGQFVNAIFGPVGLIFQMTGHQKIWQNILIITVLINLTLNILLAKDYGINGVAIATAFSMVFSKVLGVYYVKKNIWQPLH